MATSTGKRRCVICEKEKSAVRCEGCLQIFCRIHFNDHCEELSRQFDEIEATRDVFRQNLTEQINDPDKLVLIRRIELWKKQSIEVIEKTAEECKEKVRQYVNEHFKMIELKLSKVTDELREIRKENDFNEMDLKELKEKFVKLEEELGAMANISLRQDSTSFINKISVLMGTEGKK